MSTSKLAARIFSAGLLSILLCASCPAATVLITGSNAGIGLEFAKQYAAAGWTVIATHRHSTTPDTLEELGRQYKTVRAEKMDVTRAEEVKQLAEKLKDLPIDVLINNAAVYADNNDWSTQEFGKLDFELGMTMMAINALGPLLVSEAFVHQVTASEQKKIISITSTHASITQPISGSGAIFYRGSKAALNREMRVVADTLKPQGVIVVVLHPGAVHTERQTAPKHPVQIDADFSVRHMRKTIAGLTLRDTGHFLRYDGKTEPW
jgi:NAD(P)-dependent dehydrogenase (short-subunit alcohol dehydrogenase family)